MTIFEKLRSGADVDMATPEYAEAGVSVVPASIRSHRVSLLPHWLTMSSMPMARATSA